MTAPNPEGATAPLICLAVRPAGGGARDYLLLFGGAIYFPSITVLLIIISAAVCQVFQRAVRERVF